MSVNFTKSDIQRIAKLAALEIDEQRIPQYCAQLSSAFKLIDQMQAVDTQNVAPMAHPLDATARLRKDEVTIGNLRDELLACTSETEAGLILVPKVIE